MENIFPAILLMAIATYLPRVVPVLLLSDRNLPQPLIKWLSYVPVAVLAAILGPAVLLSDEKIKISIAENPSLWVTLPAFIIAIYTRSFFLTILSGMAGVALIRYFL